MRTLLKYRNASGGSAAFGASAWGYADFALIFEPRDLWIGVYHEPLIDGSGTGKWMRRFYVCLVPTIVLRVSVGVYRWQTIKRRWALGWGLTRRRRKAANSHE